jgi:hypothetical protein
MNLIKKYWLAWLAILLAIASWCARGALAGAVEAGMPKIPLPPVAACGPSGMLDLVLQGPFVLDNYSGSFVLLGPDVHDNHDLPSLIDRNIFNPRGIQAGEYTLTIADKQVGGAQICNPVGGTDLLVIPAKTENLKSDPKKLHSFAVQLPPPTEIVPWNADPMQISTVEPVPSGTRVDRLAPMVVLRYSYTPGSSIKFEGNDKATGNKVSYDLAPLVYGKESFVAIVQTEHEDDDVSHPYAHVAFDKMKALEMPLKRFVAFPSVIGIPGRNVPLIAGVEPKELTDFLTSYGATDRAALHIKDDKPAKSAGLVYMLIAHNDCKAGMIYADYTQ